MAYLVQGRGDLVRVYHIFAGMSYVFEISAQFPVNM